MTLTKKQARDNLASLIEKSKREIAIGPINEYNEKAAKIAFIQPFLKNVLGWDISDHDEVNPKEKTSL